MEIGALDFGFEFIQRDAFDRVMRKDSGKRVVEEISPSVDSHSTLLEYYRVEAELRRIHLVVVVDIADVISGEIEIRQMQRKAKLAAAQNEEPTAPEGPSLEALVEEAIARNPDPGMIRLIAGQETLCCKPLTSATVTSSSTSAAS